MRFTTIIFLYGSTIYYLGSNGVQAAPVFDTSTLLKNLAGVFGNTVFFFVFHHSISGVVTPIRP